MIWQRAMFSIGPVTIDLEPLLVLADDPIAAGWFLTANGGWVLFLLLFMWMAKALWYNHINTRYLAAKLRPVLLAIDVPKQSVQTPKGVENIFAHLAGGHGTSNRREKHLEGKVQEWFSLEIVSIDGYVQFLIWTWDRYRDLVETAIYAQYPDTQITEVQDYTTAVPHNYPHDTWDTWGTEFIYVKPFPYPLRTWEEFEHKGQKDEPFKDPLAAMLENMARIGPGEQIWLQFLIEPIGQKDWQETSVKLVKKLIGAKETSKKGVFDYLFDAIGFFTGPIYEQVFGPSEPSTPAKRDDVPSKMLYLSPGERAAVEAVEEKAAKIGFNTKIRLVYIGRKEVFQKTHGAHAVIGAIKQYNTNDLNSLKPEFNTIGPSSLWLFKDTRNNRRKTKVIKAYSKRSMWVGAPKAVMNIEELASLWHFPTEAVHAPLIMRMDAKRAVAPAGLPVEHAVIVPIGRGARTPAPEPEPPPLAPPEGLPIVE